MTHAPMTFVFRTYCLYGEPTVYAVHLCNKSGERKTITFDSFGVAKAFANALTGIGFTKKRR